MHGRTSQWQGGLAAAPGAFLGSLPPEAREARVSLTAARGVFFGTLIGGSCWGAIVAVAWLLL